MTNPISLHLRDITPIVSYPVTCYNHQMVFRDNNGMADIDVCAGADFDGVVHVLPDEQITRLDVIEGFYHRMSIQVVDYQEQPHTVYVYKMNDTNEAANLPSERYLDIIVKGCEYHNVRPDYINRLKHGQPVIPRKKPHDFKSFTGTPQNIFYSEDELAQHNGSDHTCPFWVSVNGKILEYTPLPPKDHPDYELLKRFYAFLQPRYGGREVVDTLAKVLYEPLYKLPVNNEKMTEEHRAMIEDNYFDWAVKSTAELNYWKPIGLLLRAKNLRQ